MIASTAKLKLLPNTGSCTCEQCVDCCKHKPGWFLPGEMEKAAKKMKMSVAAFFKRYIGVDYWLEEARGGPPTTFVLAPRLVGSKGGTEYGAESRGRCVFLKNGRCTIYGAHPYECRVVNHATGPAMDGRRLHLSIVERWSKKQDEIKKLLGRDPEAAPFSLLDALAMML